MIFGGGFEEMKIHSVLGAAKMWGNSKIGIIQLMQKGGKLQS